MTKLAAYNLKCWVSMQKWGWCRSEAGKVRRCDQIVVMEGGEVRATGTDAELLHNNGLFQKLSAA